MFSFTLLVLLMLTGIFFWMRYVTHVRSNKLPPGPIPLPIIGSIHLLGNLPHRALYKLSQKYGSIMSMCLGNIQVVVISSPDAAKIFLGTHDAVFASRPQVLASEYLSYGAKAMAFTAYGPHWRSVRKFCVVELLSAMKINSFVGMRREEIGLIVNEIRARATTCEIVNLSKTVSRLIENITCRMLFGRTNDERFVFRSLVEETAEVIGAFNLGDYVPILAPLDLQGLTRRLKSLLNAFDGMLETLIDEHEQHSHMGSQRPDHVDFIDMMLSLKNQYSNTHDDLSNMIDRTTMKAILVDMVVGAIDTGTSSIEWILSVLIRHPRVMKKLKKELKDVVGDKGVVDERDLTKLSYLHMVIKETFRLYPTAPLLIPHESISDIVINGYNIPKKTRVIVNVWAFGRDPKVWSENWEDFLPERFLDRAIDLRGRDFELIPFGTGRRICPGMNLALTNVSLIVSQLVHSFDWELPNGMSPMDLDMNEKFGVTMPRVKPLLAMPTYLP